MTKDGTLTHAAMLLFGKNINQITNLAAFKIGRFRATSSDLITEDTIDTNLFDLPDRVMAVLKGKYLTKPFHYQRLERMEPLEYPEPALREAILNAIIHKEYASTFIFLCIYEERLSIWNPGKLPQELTSRN